MKSYISKFSVHGLVNIEVKSQNTRHPKCLNNKYGFFSIDELSSVDIEVVIAPIKFPKKTNTIKKGIYHIGDGTMFWKNSRKLARWEVCLKGLENIGRYVQKSGIWRILKSENFTYRPSIRQINWV